MRATILVAAIAAASSAYAVAIPTQAPDADTQSSVLAKRYQGREDGGTGYWHNWGNHFCYRRGAGCLKVKRAIDEEHKLDEPLSDDADAHLGELYKRYQGREDGGTGYWHNWGNHFCYRRGAGCLKLKRAVDAAEEIIEEQPENKVLKRAVEESKAILESIDAGPSDEQIAQFQADSEEDKYWHATQAKRGLEIIGAAVNNLD